MSLGIRGQGLTPGISRTAGDPDLVTGRVVHEIDPDGFGRPSAAKTPGWPSVGTFSTLPKPSSQHAHREVAVCVHAPVLSRDGGLADPVLQYESTAVEFIVYCYSNAAGGLQPRSGGGRLQTTVAAGLVSARRAKGMAGADPEPFRGSRQTPRRICRHIANPSRKSNTNVISGLSETISTLSASGGMPLLIIDGILSFPAV
jgi:hypothetical protein